MSDQKDASQEPSVPAPSLARRPRAPTITIDTSAVESAVDLDTGSRLNSPRSSQHTTPALSPSSVRFTSAQTLVSPHSSREPDQPRPASHSYNASHHLASPSSHIAYLNVPSTRSRGNSVDSEATAHTLQSNNSNSTYNTTSNMIDPKEDPFVPKPGEEAEFEPSDSFSITPGQLSRLGPDTPEALRALGDLESGLRTSFRLGLSTENLSQPLQPTPPKGRISDPADDKSPQHVQTTAQIQPDTGNQDSDSPEASDGKQHESAVSTSRIRPKFVAQNSNLNKSDAPNQSSQNGDPEQIQRLLEARFRIFGSNRIPRRKPKSLYRLMLAAYKDKMLILLTVCAAVSIIFGVISSSIPGNHSITPCTSSAASKFADCIDGIAIVIAILIVVFVGACNDWQKEKKFAALDEEMEKGRKVKITRNGKDILWSVFDITVGDIVHLEPGEVVPCDGILAQGHALSIDESSQTGESLPVKKSKEGDLYLWSGTKVQEGTGKLLATQVGQRSTYGKLIMSLGEESQSTPLQDKLEVLASWIAKIASAAGVMIFIATFIPYIVRITRGEFATAVDKVIAFVQVLTVAVTIIVVAIPEGLPLAVTLALAFATRRMVKMKNLVRVFKACETMGNATTICTDKTGTLTTSKMTVVDADTGCTTDVLKGLLRDSIAVNSSAIAHRVEDLEDYLGPPTEVALLRYARDDLQMRQHGLENARNSYNILEVLPFDSKRKFMATLAESADGSRYVFVKGAFEIVLRMSKLCYKQEDTLDSLASPISEDQIQAFKAKNDDMAMRGLRVVTTAFRQIPTNIDTEKSASDVNWDGLLEDMTWLATLGIEDPLREDVKLSVSQCQTAGIQVRMVTGDNILTARNIATQAGILTTNGIALEGAAFREMPTAERLEIVPKLQVLARSSPDDKRLLVNDLKQLGETVAVTGDGTNDAPALQAADVGFAMGKTGTQVAKQAADIILTEDNFSAIVYAVIEGRQTYANTQKFIMFQFTVNISAVLTAFITAVYNPTAGSILTPVQLLWINMIMDSLAALALATDAPHWGLLDQKPIRRDASLISLNMWKMIIGQGVYQLIVCLTLFFAGDLLVKEDLSGRYGAPCDQRERLHKATLIFNVFVWMQLFNQYNCRRLDNNLNIFQGALKNWYFLSVQAVMIGLQVVIVLVAGFVFNIDDDPRLGGIGWAVSIGFGVLSLLVGAMIRIIPNAAIRAVVDPIWARLCRLKKQKPVDVV